MDRHAGSGKVEGYAKKGLEPHIGFHAVEPRQDRSMACDLMMPIVHAQVSLGVVQSHKIPVDWWPSV